MKPKAVAPLCICALVLFSLFTGEIRDNDIFWHLRTGQYILETHSLPVPDPFAFTSTGASYPGEEITRFFNLTHEWLTQILMLLVYRLTGFAGLVIARALLLTAFCALVGWIVFGRTRDFYGSLAASLAAGGMSYYFAQSRPAIVTFVFLALTIAILETRRRLWLLPPLFLIWANCHGGFVLGWIACGLYCLEALIGRLRGSRMAGDVRLWLISGVSIMASALNPSGFRVLEVFWFYRKSGIQMTNLEWQRPIFWTPGIYSFLLFGSLLLLVIAWRRARLIDWLLYFTFSAISLAAVRNTIFMGLAGPIVIATYLPKWKPLAPLTLSLGMAALVAFDAVPAVSSGGVFKFRAADWQYPSGAADFIESHHLTGRMFNNYEDGGYLIWRLWPLERVFIDGRALSEEAFADYRRILYDTSGGKTAGALLDKYKIDLLVLPGFDYLSGQVYPVAVDAATAAGTPWTLAYADARGLVFLRHPPASVTPLNAQTGFLDSLAAQCEEHVRHDALHPRCAFGLGELYAFRGKTENARQWMSYYLEHSTAPDSEASRILESLNVTVLSNQAVALQSKGDLPAAEPLFRQALAIAQRTLGPEHPDTAGAMNNLAGLLEAEGNYAEAETLYRKSLEICETKLGPSDPRTAMALDNLAGVLEATGDTATAESLYRRALAIAQTALGPEDPATKTIAQDLKKLQIQVFHHSVSVP